MLVVAYRRGFIGAVNRSRLHVLVEAQNVLGDQASASAHLREGCMSGHTVSGVELADPLDATWL